MVLSGGCFLNGRLTEGLLDAFGKDRVLDTPLAESAILGTSIGMAMAAAEQLSELDMHVRVVSMPNTGRFKAQERIYRESVLPSDCTARIAVEAGVSNYWYSFVGDKGRVIGLDGFGASAPATELFEYFGLTIEKISAAVTELLDAETSETE